MYLTLLFVLMMLTGCQFTQTAFSKTTSNAGAAFSAAATTFEYAHQGKLTIAYARASFVSFKSQLSGLDQQLPSQQGAPDTHSVQHLLQLYQVAMQVVKQPCWSASCNWHTQLAALQQASQAFTKAGNA